ncbi:MAG: ATP-binding protein [Myxococcales bacterium]
MRRFRQWAESILPNFQAASTLGSWAATAAIAGLMVFVATRFFADEYFQLRPTWALVAFAIAAVLDLAAGRVPKRGNGVLAFGALNIIGSFFLQLFSGLLMVSSNPWGAAVFSPTLLLTALYHGHLHRATPRHPYQALASLVAVVATASLCPSGHHLAIVAVSGPVAVFGSLVFGVIAERGHQMRSEAERLRAAISAQMIREQSTRADRLANTIEQLSMWNHDIRNALTVIAGHSKLLASIEPEEYANPESAKEARASVDLIRNNLRLVSEGLDRMREIAKQHNAELTSAEVVEVLPIAQAVAQAAHVRFPDADIKVVTRDSASGLRVRVNGGSVTLHRAIENLVVNACEGDGSRGATRVEVCLAPAGDNVVVEVIDDGPGFTREQLAQGVVGFQTSKSHGTGLGLYTVERLVAASGGSLVRDNRETGGACVALRLPAGEPA